MIVVEHESVAVSVVLLAADPQIPRTEVAIGHIFRDLRLFTAHGLAAPRPVLPVRRNDHPLFPQRMPAFLPKHFFFPVRVAASRREAMMRLAKYTAPAMLALLLSADKVMAVTSPT